MTKLSDSHLLTIESIPSNSHVLTGLKNTMDILFNILTKELPDKGTRQPLNLAIVLDRSGSMSGEEKLSNSKKAIIGILGKLTKDDVVHFVTYETQVEVVFENVQIDSESTLREITQTVEKVQPSGMTNLGGGLSEGVRLINKFQSNNQLNKRVFLFSDGRVNVGIRTKPQLFGLATKYMETGISLTTFGLGSDYDEELMKGLSERGGGVYYFIDKGSDINFHVSRAIDGLLGLVGTQGRLKVRGKNFGIVTKIWGQEDESLIDGAMIGEIKENNARQILVRLEVTPPNNSNNDQTQESVEEVMSYSFEYLPMDSSSIETISGTIKLTLTENSELLKTNKNEEVEVILAVQKAAETDKLILEDLERGEIEEALKKEKKNVEELEKVVKSDKKGQVQFMLSNANSTYQQIQKEGNNSTTKKKVHHAMYTKSRCSYFDSAGYF